MIQTGQQIMTHGSLDWWCHCWGRRHLAITDNVRRLLSSCFFLNLLNNLENICGWGLGAGLQSNTSPMGRLDRHHHIRSTRRGTHSLGGRGRRGNRPCIHNSHPPAEELRLLQTVLQLLLLQFVLDVQTEWNRTLLLRTVFRMVTAKGNKLFANWTTTICFPFANFRMLCHSLHLLTTGQSAISVATLTRMYQ